MEFSTSLQECLRILERGLLWVANPEGRASLLCLQGSALARLKRFAEAQASFEQAIRLAPDEPRNFYFMALHLLEPQARWQDAASLYRRALQLHPCPQDRKKIEQALDRVERKRKTKTP